MAAPDPGSSVTNVKRWYQASIVFSVLAFVFALVSHLDARLGYPLFFIFSMWGILALTRPDWDRKERRRRVVLLNMAALVVQSAILIVGLAPA